MSTTINTFHSSFNPPPVPPRASHRGPALPSNTPLVKFISVLLLLLIIQSFGGFIYLFHRISTQLQDRRNDNEISALKLLQQCAEEKPASENVQYCSKLMELYSAVLKKVSAAEGRAAFLTETGSYTIPQARLVLKDERGKSNTLIWSTSQSGLEKISLSMSGVLTIQYPGYYLIQSQVTFSKAHVKDALKQAVWTQKAGESPSELFKTYCSLPRVADPNKIPDLCTTSESVVFRFEKGQTLFVNVTDRELVNVASTTFRLFRLQD